MVPYQGEQTVNARADRGWRAKMPAERAGEDV
jgi:hypothetical protein